MPRTRTAFCSACAIGIVLVVTFLALRYCGSTYYDRNTAAQADLIGIATQLNLYRDRNGSYPITEQGLHSLVARPAASPVPQHWIAQLREVPSDPWQHPYVYRYPSAKDPTTFDLFSVGSDGVESTDDIWLQR